MEEVSVVTLWDFARQCVHAYGNLTTFAFEKIVNLFFEQIFEAKKADDEGFGHKTSP
jgi:hypothetical protein